MKIRELSTGSVVYGKLPRGCELCQRGLKTVIFLTGLCPGQCFYCPLSDERKGKDVIFVNEKLVSPEELLRASLVEVMRSASAGASITGGEPLLKRNLVINLVSFLKEKLGDSFHVHLYTSGAFLDNELAEKLADTGVNELRIHAPLHSLERILGTLELSDVFSSVGLEYPSLPGSLEYLVRLLEIAEKYELDFIVLNELEFTETNAQSLLLRGYSMRPDYRAAYGSKEVALQLIEEAERRGVSTSVHFCPVSVKDGVQTALRVYRYTNLNALPYHSLTDEGTVLEIEYTSLKRRETVTTLYHEGKLPVFFAEKVAAGSLLERSMVLGGLILEEVPLREFHSKVHEGKKGGEKEAF